VEYRVLNAAVLAENFDASSADAAKITDVQPDGGFDDEGLSFHVVDATDGTERIRIDVFDDDPHYHYMLTPDEHIMVTYDASAHGDMLDWAISALRDRLPDMLKFAGANELADRVDPTTIASSIDVIEHAARNAKEVLGPQARARLAEAESAAAGR
jgi:hypothetical protein